MALKYCFFAQDRLGVDSEFSMLYTEFLVLEGVTAMAKKVLITVGGTGGHVYPAMALAHQLKQEDPNIELMFVGGGLNKNPYFEPKLYFHKEVTCGALLKKNPFSAMWSAWNILRGFFQSQRILKAFRPDVVVGFGSFYTLPTLLAAYVKRVPIVLHEANSVPGKVNRLFSKRVKITGIQFPETAALLKGPTQIVSIPLRAGYRHGSVSHEDARAHFLLHSSILTILVFGGSQGAKGINQLFSSALHKLPPSLLASIQILHFTGDSTTTHQLQEQYAKLGIRSKVKDFETRMDLAWQAADLMISRAGAGTIVEQLEFEVPGILIPYPHATDNHQEKNADFMVDTVKGSIKCLQHNLDADKLAQEIMALLADSQQPLKTMRQAIHSYKRLTKPQDLCSLVREV